MGHRRIDKRMLAVLIQYVTVPTSCVCVCVCVCLCVCVRARASVHASMHVCV